MKETKRKESKRRRIDRDDFFSCLVRKKIEKKNSQNYVESFIFGGHFRLFNKKQ